MTSPAELLSIYTNQSQMSSFFIDKMGVISVKSYGAKGGGVVDDTDAVQSAIDAGATALFWPEDSYNVGALAGYANIPFYSFGEVTFTNTSYTVYNVSSHMADYAAHGIGERAKYLTPTGTADDTSYLQAMLAVYPYIILRPGTYYIDAVTKLIIPSNRTIMFEEGAVFQCITNNASVYSMISINADNVTLYNPTCIGDRLTHTGVTGEWGFGIAIGVADNIKVYNPVCNNCWGDGIYIGGTSTSNIYIENAYCDNNRRQGMTITNGINVFVNGAYIKNTNGAAPESGIDLEPDNNTQEMKGIYLKNIITENNNGIGVNVNIDSLYNAAKDVYIEIDGHMDIGSNIGFCVYHLRKPTLGITGTIINKNGYYKNSVYQGVLVQDYAGENTPILNINNTTIVDANTTGDTSPLYGSAIALIRLAGDIGTTILGNIFIDGFSIIDTRTPAKHVRGVYCRDEKDVGFVDTILSNPKKISGIVATTMINYNANGITVRDPFEVTTLSTNLSASTIFRTTHAKIMNTGAGEMAVFTLNQSLVNDSPITFINVTSFGLRVKPQGTQNILPISAVGGKYIQTTVMGASITIKQISATQYIILNMIGTWTVES